MARGYQHPIIGGGGEKSCPTYTQAINVIRNRCEANPGQWEVALKEGIGYGGLLKFRLYRSGSRYGIGVSDPEGREFMVLQPFFHDGEWYTVHRLSLPKTQLLENHWHFIPFNVTRMANTNRQRVEGRHYIHLHRADATNFNGAESGSQLEFGFPVRSAKNAGTTTKLGYCNAKHGGPWADDYCSPIYALRDSDGVGVAFTKLAYPEIRKRAHLELGAVAYSTTPELWIRSIDSSQQKLAAGIYRRYLELAGKTGKVALWPRRFGTGAIHLDFMREVLPENDWAAIVYFAKEDDSPNVSFSRSVNGMGFFEGTTRYDHKISVKKIACADDAVAGFVEKELMAQLPLA